MENKLNLLFDFKGHEIEIFEFNGKVLFNPKHIARCLDITDSALRNHLADMNEKQRIKLTNAMISNVPLKDIRKLHNTGEVFVTESGVYTLLIKSRKQEAIVFQNWITDEVLPQIRKTGGYIPVSEQDTEETIQQRAQEIANETIKYKDKEIARLKESYEQEHEARLRLIKTYNESKKEIRGLQNELDEAYVKMDLVPLMMEIQNKCEPPRELDLKSIIIKMNDTSKGYQRYKQWVEDNCMTDGAVDKECGHFLKHSKLHCFTKQYIFDLESVDALYYLALMFEEVMLNC